MKVLPIIFSAPMVLALLAGRKTMTRRLLYSLRKVGPLGPTLLQSDPDPKTGQRTLYDPPVSDAMQERRYTLTGWEKVKPGDLLYVRENLTAIPTGTWLYAADKTSIGTAHGTEAAEAWALKEGRGIVPSIHMPRWASRITIEVGEKKIERVNDISEEDARAEGCGLYIAGHGWITMDEMRADPGYSAHVHARNGFEDIWRTLHGDQSWEQNPWVVAMGGKIHFHNVDSPAMKKLTVAA